jgi:hypothetical protein
METPKAKIEVEKVPVMSKIEVIMMICLLAVLSYFFLALFFTAKAQDNPKTDDEVHECNVGSYVLPCTAYAVQIMNLEYTALVYMSKFSTKSTETYIETYNSLGTSFEEIVAEYPCIKDNKETYDALKLFKQREKETLQQIKAYKVTQELRHTTQELINTVFNEYDTTSCITHDYKLTHENKPKDVFDGDNHKEDHKKVKVHEDDFVWCYAVEYEGDEQAFFAKCENTISSINNKPCIPYEIYGIFHCRNPN